MKKPRIQSSLDRQPLHVTQAIRAMLTTGGRDGHGLTYKEAAKRILDEFGLKLGTAALCNFYRRQHKASSVPQVAGQEITILPGQTSFTLTIKIQQQATAS